MEIDFGIVVYKNSHAELLKLIKSIQASAHQAEIGCSIHLLLNSPCTIDSDITQHCDTVVPYHANLGFGAGHNKLFSRIVNPKPWYAPINPDGFLLPSALKNAKNWVAGTNNIYEFKQTPQEHPKPYNTKNGHTNWSSGAAFIISRDLYKSLEGFDDRFFMYHEDVDLSWRVRHQGGRCILMADALFFHDVIEREVSENAARAMSLSRSQLMEKWRYPLRKRSPYKGTKFTTPEHRVDLSPYSYFNMFNFYFLKNKFRWR